MKTSCHLTFPSRSWPRLRAMGLTLGLLLGVLPMVLPSMAMAQVTVAVEGDRPATLITMRNEHLEVGLRPWQRPGMIDRFIHLASGQDLSASSRFPQGEGIATQRTNLGYLFHKASDIDARVVESSPDKAVVEVIYSWQDQRDGQAMHFAFLTRYTLRRDESRLEVDWHITNLADGVRSIAPWLKHTSQNAQAGSHYGVRDQGPVALPSDLFMPSLTNWIARTGAQGEPHAHTFFSVIEHEKVHQFYHWRQHDLYTHEMIYQPAQLATGQSWQTRHYLGLAPAMPGATFASPQGLVALTPGSAEVGKDVEATIHIAGVTDLGRVRIEGELILDGKHVLPLGPRHIHWRAGHVERISYSLNLRQPGVYRLQLNVYGPDGSQIPLGKEVGAFEQALDLPLVVGTLPAGTVVSQAWPKAPVVYPPIEARDLKLPWAGKTDGVRVAISHPADRVFREDRLDNASPRLRQITRSAARGEWESFPLVVFASPQADKPAQVTLNVTSLKHAQSGRVIEGLRPYVVSHVVTQTPSRLRMMPVGRYPDPLLPLEGPVTLPAGENIHLWVNVRVPTDAPAGDYESQWTLTLDGQSITLPVKLHVWDFNLPHPAALRTWAGFVGWNVSRQMEYMGVKDYDVNAFRQKLYQWCTEYGFAPGHGARYTVDELASLEKTGRGLSTLFGGARTAQAWATQENVQAHGWQGRVYQYAPFDEHLDHTVPKVVEWTTQFKEANPHIKVLDVYYGTNTQPLYGLVDVWCRQIERAPWVQERLAAGDEFWGVNSHLIGMIEAPILPGRQEYWKLFDHGYTGQLLWSVSPWGYKPPDYQALGVNAIAMVLYPTADGPTTSIRWENMRDGLEDYDYLAVLAQRVKAAQGRAGVPADALAQAMQILHDPDLHQKIASTASLETLRERIARLIVALTLPADTQAAHSTHPSSPRTTSPMPVSHDDKPTISHTWLTLPASWQADAQIARAAQDVLNISQANHWPLPSCKVTHDDTLPTGSWRRTLVNGTIHLAVADAEGARCALDALLADQGVRWSAPGKPAIVPAQRRELADRLAIPDMSYRGLHICVAPQHYDPAVVTWMSRLGMNRKLTHHRELQTIEAPLLAQGIAPDTTVHSFEVWIPDHAWFDKHPEWFSLVGGQRIRQRQGGQLCLSNTAMRAQFITHMRQMLDEHPGMKVVGVCPNDGYGWCECDGCKQLDERRPASASTTTISPGVNGRVADFVEELCDAIGQSHPDAQVGIYCYSNFRDFPLLLDREHKNLLISCTLFRCMRHALDDPDCEMNRPMAAHLQKVRAKVGELYTYEYYMHRWEDLPAPIWRTVARDMQAIRQWDASGFLTEVLPASHKAWDSFALPIALAAAAMWDADLDVDAFLDQWCADLYGPAAPAMRRYLDALEQGRLSTQDCTRHSPRDLPRLLPMASLDQAAAALTEAASQTLPAEERHRVAQEQQRVAFWRDLLTQQQAIAQLGQPAALPMSQLSVDAPPAQPGLPLVDQTYLIPSKDAPSQVWAFADEDHVGLLIECMEPRMDDLKLVPGQGLGPVYSSDGVEVFFANGPDSKMCYHLLISADGRLAASSCLGPRWNWSWPSHSQITTRRLADRWRVAVKMPRSSMAEPDMPAPDRSIVSYLVARNRYIDGWQISGWPLGTPSFSPENYWVARVSDSKP